MLRNLTLFLIGIIVISTSVSAVQTISIDRDWQFCQADSGDWMSADVPGCVHTDLMNNGNIANPYYRDVEQDVQWIGMKDWEYKTVFQVGQQLLSRECIEITFYGLDTYADVYLNEEKILSADNMFRTWSADVKELLNKGENTLRIYFHSVFKINVPKWESAEFRLIAPDNNDQSDVQISMYSRKAGYHFGWDWGPRLVTAGIWRPVVIRAWDTARLEEIQVFQQDLNEQRANLNVQAALNVQRQGGYTLKVFLDGKPAAEKALDLKPGMHQVDLPIVIHNPELWWTHDLGDQPLYDIQVQFSGARKSLDDKAVKVGVRDLEFVQETDEYGTSFYFKLNGEPLYIKGANYIPQDNFQNRVTPERYDKLLNDAVRANMNMLRIWGGGIYEEDVFYQLCDEKGLLVWQDFMFACAMYPGDQAFFETVRQEAVDNVKRLRNHPSIALWCGNNENQVGWKYWGWKDGLTEEQQASFQNDMDTLFEELLPGALHSVDPDQPYIPSSPMAGWGGRGPEDGDNHYWGVWHVKHPFDQFDDNIARFMSEWGFQGFPDIHTVRRFTIPEDREIDSRVMLLHQRCWTDNRQDKLYANRLIDQYMQRHYKQPKDFESYLFVSQLLQAKAMEMAVDAHRRSKPFCMGTLYWQLEDCWPVTSWSSIDYYGNWKASHYMAEDMFQDFLISPVLEQDSLDLYLVSDRRAPVNGRLLLQVFDFSGQVLTETKLVLELPKNCSKTVFSAPVTELTAAHDPAQVLLKMTFKSQDGDSISRLLYFKPEKELQLEDPEVEFEIRQIDSQDYEIILTSESLAKNVYVTADSQYIQLSDNYMDVIPGQPCTVELRCKKTLEQVRDMLMVRSLYDTFE